MNVWESKRENYLSSVRKEQSGYSEIYIYYTLLGQNSSFFVRNTFTLRSIKGKETLIPRNLTLRMKAAIYFE